MRPKSVFIAQNVCYIWNYYQECSSQGQAPTNQTHTHAHMKTPGLKMCNMVIVTGDNNTKKRPDRSKEESRVMSVSFNIFMCHTQFTLAWVLLVLSVSHLNNCLLLTQNCYCFVATTQNFSNLFSEKYSFFCLSTLSKIYTSIYTLYKLNIYREPLNVQKI